MKHKQQILICGGGGCLSAGSKELKESIERAIKEENLDIKVTLTGCFGFCKGGIILKILPEEIYYVNASPSDAQEIVKEHIIKGELIKRLLLKNPVTGECICKREEYPFYKKQVKRVLKNCGEIDPKSIEEYIEVGGYRALKKVLSTMTPKDVVKEILNSGLRGRGGGGFLTGKKWEVAAAQTSQEKYIVCNADEGDPGAFMDRALLEGDPHSVIEGMIIAGYGIGASKGLVYVRAEYPLAIERLIEGIDQCREKGLLGEKILGSDLNFDIEIKIGAGAFVCGEETALIHSMEGKRGEPTNKPPYPAISGYWDKPTVVNNVETLGNLPRIILEGAETFRTIGTKDSPGTKVFALAGKINNVGLVEVPMGTTLREVIYDIGGGIRGGKKFKAVQTGGPSGGCLTERDLDTPIDFDTLKEIGSMMGSGGMIVMDEDDCMVAVSKFYLEFTVDESCGKCTSCRIGNTRLLEILAKITEGNGEMEDLEKLKELGEGIKDTALCGLGQTSPNPVLSTLIKFWDEYVAHVKDKKCPAKQCKALVKYMINDKCVGCTSCARICPVHCITGKPKEKHQIGQDRCIKCGSCKQVCKFNAIDKI